MWKFFKKSRGETGESVDSNEAEIAGNFKSFHRLPHDIHHHVSTRTTPAFTKPIGNLVYRGVTMIELEKALKKLISKPSRGPDEIPQHVLKRIGPKAKEFLLHLYNFCLRTGKTPQLWKSALVRALPKPQGGFRPISLLCSVAKLLESIVDKRLRDECMHKVPVYQYAVRGGTEVAIENLVKHVEEKSKQGQTCYAAFLDAVKAFDRVYIPKLIELLGQFGLDRYMLNWLTSYLLDRRAFVGDPRFRYKLANGVPQGSILSPLLFVLYVSLLFDGLEVTFKAQYADDFRVMCADTNPVVAVSRLNNALTTISKRCRDLAVTLDGAKCKAMWLRTGRQKPAEELEVRLDDRVLEYVSEYKYLGIVLDRRLQFDSMIKKKVMECTRRSGFVWRLIGACKRKSRALWLGYCGSYLMYGLTSIFHRLTKARQQKLEAMYARAAKAIVGLIPSTFGPLAVEEAGMEPLSDCIARRRANLLNRMNGIKAHQRFRSPPHNVVELDGPHSRQQELTFGRWRTNALYSNVLKWKMKARGDDLCRLCGNYSETREHVLFECQQVEKECRMEYLEKVCCVLQCESQDLTLDHVLALNGKLAKEKVQKLAVALWVYLDKIEYVA
jgi:hypothetical protein